MARRAFHFRYTATTTTAKIAVVSLSNNDVTITINGIDYTLSTWNDIDSVGGTEATGKHIYSGVQSISGLSVNGSYPISVEQDGTTYTGVVYTNPTGDHTIHVVGCDNYLLLNTGSCWSDIKAFAQGSNPSSVALIHIEDHGYTDLMIPDDTAVTGNYITSNVITEGTDYARALGYAMYLGLLENDEQDIGAIPEFHDTDRIWCWQNMATYSSLGDHELYNNPEEASDAGIAAKITTATTVFQQILGKAMDFLDTSASLAWIKEIGAVEYTAYDRISGLGTTRLFNPTDGSWAVDTGQNTWLGSAQITDIVGGVNSTSPFKCLICSAGSKYLMSETDQNAVYVGDNDWDNPAWMGAQQPLHDYTRDANGDSEWKTLLTKKSPAGIATICQDNGIALFALHGDTHHSGDQWHYEPETSTHRELDMREYFVGAVGGNRQHKLYTTLVEDYSYKGSHIKWLPSDISRDPNTPVKSNTFVRLNVTDGGSINLDILEKDNTTPIRTVEIKRGGKTTGEHLRVGYV